MKQILFMLSFLFLPVQTMAADITLMVIDNNSYMASRAVEGLGLDVEVVASGELATGGEELRGRLNRSKVIIVDVMGLDLENYLLEQVELKGKVVYGVRFSTDDEQLQSRGFTFDDELNSYYRQPSLENMANLVRLAAKRHLDPTIAAGPPTSSPRQGLYHPEAGQVFANAADYLSWQQQRPGFDPARPTVGLLFFSSYLTPGQDKPIPYIIRELEKAGFNVLPCFGRDQDMVDSFLLNKRGKARVDMVLAFTLKFSSALTPELAAGLQQLNVPVISAISLYGHTLDEWRDSPVGIGGNEVAWSVANPEISGLIEPTPLAAKQKVTDPGTGKSFFVSEPIPENVERVIGRLKGWANLQAADNSRKKIAIMFYNHHQGKQNIGAAYLNVFRSLQKIIAALDKSGYRVGNIPPSEEKIKQMIMTSARNIGSWAPGELDRLLQSSQVVRLPLARYEKWFNTLPVDLRGKIIAQWGRPQDSTIMRDGDDFIIPAVAMGNILLLPEPARGFSDDPMKLYHDTTIFPHHQYLAAYLWLQHGFQADGMIHLGTHSTYEWTPGKQAGLSPSCPPEVLIGNIPNIYPYIVDDVGEGIQAKRRGRGVMVSYLTPAVKEAGLHDEYGRMAELVGEYERARARSSDTAPLKLAELKKLAAETGITEDLAADRGHYHGGMDDDDGFARELGHYLEEIRDNLIPYGMHTFGVSPGPEEAQEMTAAVIKGNPDEKRAEILERINQSGPTETASLLAGLSGDYVAPGEGNDPIRNPGALPTGRNFYGLNPARLPSAAAWELGKKAAGQIIADYRQKHQKFPGKVAVVLWATETLRNEGVNESTLLYLMGIRPKWSKTGLVSGVEVIPGRELKRPRIDVMISASGLYRDLFPDKMELLDQAVQLAVRQTDIDNLLADNSARIRQTLLRQGMNADEAEELSRLRVFSQEPGSYGNGVAEMASNSGLWQEEREVADVYENRMGFVFGGSRWGAPARELLKENLAGVAVTMHSRSSNILGLLDTDDMFMALGGLSMAVRLESGQTPETLITRQIEPGKAEVEDLAKTLGREMRSRYLNRKWLEGMKGEDYAGAREMAHFVEYLWGWQVTTPEKVDEAKWQQAYEVYVEDKYGLELKDFFNRASPWAHQSITARMLETVRKGYWQAPEKVRQKLAVDYAVSVVEKGVACCDHTCNNPLLNQMVVAIISLPGVMTPEMVEKFKLAIEQSAQKTLSEQVARLKTLQQQLTAPGRPEAGKQSAEQQAEADRQPGETEVEGYKMEKMTSSDDATQVTSSGVEWLAGLLVLFIIGLAAYGAWKIKLKNYQ